MNKPDQKIVTDIIEWDVLNWSQLIPYWSDIIENMPADSKVLAIGERNGGITLWLALNGLNVVCTDRVGPAPAAVEMHKRYNVAHLITYESFDVVNNSGENMYDLIIAKSVIGGIKSDYSDRNTRTRETRIKAVNNIHRLLKPGGYALIAENTQGSFFVNFARKVLGKQTGWHYFTQEEIKDVFSIFPNLHSRAFGVIPTVFRNNIANRLMFSLNKYVFDLLPASSKYIAFITGRK